MNKSDSPEMVRSSDGLGLVERLRQQYPETLCHRDALHREAADEIERLRGIVPETLETLNDALCAENDDLRTRLLKVEHWAKHAMLMRSTQNDEVLRIVRGEA